MPTYEEVRERFEKEDKLEFFEQGINDACDKIMRQTDYTKDVSLEKLKQHNMEIMSVVREWMGVETIKKPERTSNQMVFDEFRSFLDEASSNYYKRKEMQKAQEEYVQRMREAASIELERRKKQVAEKKALQSIDEDMK
jgi:hypothetical protein